MNALESLPLKKAFLYSLIASVALSAVLGIGIILTGEFGWFGLRVILTTITIAGASICGLACGTSLGAGTGRWLPLAGIILSLISAAMMIVGMWAEIEMKMYWQTAVSGAVLAVAFAHVSLLSLARLSPRFQWSQIAARAVIFTLAALSVEAISYDGPKNVKFRLMAVLAILSATMTIVIPILHRLSRPEIETEPDSTIDIAAIDAEIAELHSRIAVLERLKVGSDES